MVAPNPKPKPAANVKVVIRIRPLSKKERARGCEECITEMNQDYGVDTEGPQVLQVAGHVKRWFEYDAVLGNQSTQAGCYELSGAQRAVTEDIFKGYNATLLAYGQTGAGKTYSMGTFGNDDDADDVGILPRACQDLFDTIDEKCDGNGKVELSYLEIYNEEIRDLLSDKTPANPEKKTPNQLKIRETLNGEVYVSGLIEQEVKSSQEIGEVLAVAATRRVVGSTAMNAVSSRSHAICTFKVSGVLEGGEKFTSKLTLVDLAGSERIKKTGAQGSRQLEGIHINKSLMVLGQVVSALAQGNKRRPPYRDSKLTRLLQDSLGGNSRTIMLACVSPADYNVEESTNTLRYATSARNIKNTATRNIVQEISQEEAMALQRENQLLKQQVAELQENLRNVSNSPESDDGSPGALSDGEDDGEDGGTHTNGGSGRSTELDKEVRKLNKQLSAAQINLRKNTDTAIQLPALKMEIAQLKLQLANKVEVEKENDELRQDLEDARMDAVGARQAAAKLSGIMDQLKSLKQDEVNKKQVQLKHKRKEKEWVDFVAKILNRRTDQLKQLQEDFELVIKVVESPAVYQTEEKKGWFGRKEFKEIYDPDLREKVLKEHVSFFKDRMDEIQNDIFVRAISLQGIKDRIETQCYRMSEEIDNKQVEADGFDTKEGDVLAKLVDMLIDPDEKSGTKSTRQRPSEVMEPPPDLRNSYVMS